ncbi:MAG: SDR family oxidoreductase [Kofleriaceae bacterium]|nr:SDR family oxidoreductase [Myxococcales bacterium]MCB9561748.1 SDR family oxidoreductase [Kofleriaceae bacterium]MCB9573703.1 SDR family oxidoreductase [Kofleriaceae bacterium]
MSTPTRIVVITGGSRGLGRSMALHLADRGTDVILTYQRAADRAAEVVAEIEARGRAAVALPLDAGDAGSFAGFADAVRGELARRWHRTTFDGLVNNAGMAGYAPFAETSEAQFDDLMRVHLKGPYFLTQRLLPLIADGGSIVNISTGLARFSFPGSSAYAVMKGGVEVLTRYLARELGPRDINVNTLAPGAIETDFGGGHVRDDRALNAQIAGSTALGRVGLPDDIGGAVALLLAPENHWITGQRIEASGGMLL